MHELSLAISIIEGVEAEALARGGLKVEIVHLRLGILSGVDKEALLFSYGIACEGTSLEGSRMEIEVTPLLVYCPECGMEHSPASTQHLRCPTCLVPAQEIRHGQELEVTGFEVAA